jgi:acetyl esterase/lipase
MTHAQRIAIDARLRQGTLDLDGGPEELRAGFAALMATRPIPAGVTIEPTRLAGLEALALTPEAAARPGVLLYFHGGAFIIGSPATAAHLTAQLVRRAGVRAVSIDYRLAPEHPLPAAIEDGVAAYRALLDDGVEPGRIVFAGDSAGGGLTITTMLAARDAGLPMPAGGVAFSAAGDATRSGASMDTKEGVDPIFDRRSLTHLAGIYLAGQDPHHPLLSPAVAADLTGLPPLLLQVGSNEVLLDDSVRLAARAAAAGVDVVLDVTGDVAHVFQSYAGELDEADRALDRAARFVRERLTAGPEA